MNMRKHRRRIYQRSIAVLRYESFFDGCWIVSPGVYARPLGRLAKPDRKFLGNDLHSGC